MVAVEEKLKISLYYSIAVAIIIVMALAISSMFMSVSQGDPFEVIASVLLNTLVILFIFFLCILASVALGFAFLFFRLDDLQTKLILKLQDIAQASAAPAAAPAGAGADVASEPNVAAVADFIRSNPGVELGLLVRQLEHAGFGPEAIRRGVERARPEKAPEKK